MAKAAEPADATLADRIVSGDKRALARGISLVENRDPEGDRLVAEVFPRTGKARVVGITGPPGVGKSTLIGALTKELRKADRSVGVLSIDPSSPFTQGAMLGDRIRLAEHFLDSEVFIRSMATRGSLGGLAEAALQAALLMDAAGKDDVLLETVGVGQGEIDIVDHADTIVLALMPGSGDSIQALKAGVMEIPDVIVVNKGDHPLADTMIREVRSALGLGPQGDWKVPVVRTEAVKDEGIGELLRQIDAHREHITETGSLAERRARNLRAEVLGIAAARLRRQLEERATSDPDWEDLLASVTRRETDPASAAQKAAGDDRRCLNTKAPTPPRLRPGSGGASTSSAGPRWGRSTGSSSTRKRGARMARRPARALRAAGPCRRARPSACPGASGFPTRARPSRRRAGPARSRR